MMYSSKLLPESPQTDLRVDIIINRIKQSVKRITTLEHIYESQILERINSQIELLKNEIHIPPCLKSFIYKSHEKERVTDEDVKFYLYSILTPKKLHSLRKWVTTNKSEKENSEYNVEVILHIHACSEEIKDMYARQLSSINNENGSCSITSERLTNTIQKAVDNVLNNKGQKLPSKLIISMLELLKREIFNSNSTKLFSHQAANSDHLVKGYLFSKLSAEKLKALRIWLYRNKKSLISNKHQQGIITSIYVPD